MGGKREGGRGYEGNNLVVPGRETGSQCLNRGDPQGIRMRKKETFRPKQIGRSEGEKTLPGRKTDS